jgi:hypothetical protein
MQSARYASSHQEEAEADKSIHLEAIERSRVSQGDFGGGKSFVSSVQDSYGGFGGRVSTGSLPSTEFEPDDFGAPDFDVGDDGGGGLFHDGDHRFSSESFQAIGGEGNDMYVETHLDRADASASGGISKMSAKGAASHGQIQKPTTAVSHATILLDAIASGDISTTGGVGSFGTGGGYQYYDNKELDRLVESSQLSQGINSNLWAGAEHWKKGKRATNKNKQTTAKDSDANQDKSQVAKKKIKKSSTGQSDSGTTVLVDVTNPINGLEQLLGSFSSGKRSNRGNGKTKLFRWSDAAVAKHAKTTNLLPHDAGLTVGELTKLFLRPKANLASIVATKQNSHPAQKTVGFSDMPGGTTFDDASYGYDNHDEGVGFDFAGGSGDDDASNGTNDFVIAELDDVRKVRWPDLFSYSIGVTRVWGPAGQLFC